MKQVNLFRVMAAALKSVGAEIVEIDPSEMPSPIPTREILPYGFRDSLNRFLKGLGSEAPLSSLAEVTRLNKENPVNRAPYGQSYLTGAADTSMTRGEHEKLVQSSKTSASGALEKIFRKHNIKTLISDSQAYAAAGFPAITVPAGYKENGEPFGLVMVGNANGEADLITAGYAFEQTVKARKPPDLDKTIMQIRNLQQ
jgi:amidase